MQSINRLLERKLSLNQSVLPRYLRRASISLTREGRVITTRSHRISYSSLWRYWIMRTNIREQLIFLFCEYCCSSAIVHFCGKGAYVHLCLCYNKRNNDATTATCSLDPRDQESEKKISTKAVSILHFTFTRSKLRLLRGLSLPHLKECHTAYKTYALLDQCFGRG